MRARLAEVERLLKENYQKDYANAFVLCYVGDVVYAVAISIQTEKNVILKIASDNSVEVYKPIKEDLIMCQLF